LIVEKVIYMCICDSSYPRKLAFSYLDELSKEFQRSYEGKIEAASRPYAFMGFGTPFCSGMSGADDRYLYLENDSAVSGFPYSYAGGRRTGRTGQSIGSIERESARCNEDYDEEHGGSALARRQLGP
jgi:hypothetical protein